MATMYKVLPCENCSHEHRAKIQNDQVTQIYACEVCDCTAETWVLEGEE